MNTADYIVKLSPTTFLNGTWQTNPALNVGNWIITNKTSNAFTVAFYTIPIGGLRYDVEITENL
jgi:hypothetical protein